MSPAPDALLFGTAGVPLGSEDTSTVKGIEHTFVLGLDCQEIEFVNGVKMGLDTAHKIAAKAASRKVRLSAHAPYFINLNSEDRGKRLQSQERILATAGSRMSVAREAPSSMPASTERARPNRHTGRSRGSFPRSSPSSVRSACP